MGILLYSRPEMKKILRELPMDVLNHMKRVEVNVGAFTDILYKSGEPIKGLPRHKCNYFGIAAFYHDIGKALISPNTLLKPGKLNKREWDLIRKHPIYSMHLFTIVWENILPGQADRTFKLVFDAAIYHHERWDGCGYPMGLRGREIPLIARITALCDAYDSMTNCRPYREALPREYARAEILANAGTQFDPQLAEIFLANESKLTNYSCPGLMQAALTQPGLTQPALASLALQNPLGVFLFCGLVFYADV